MRASFYALRGACAWSLLPKDFPPWPTVYRWFARFRADGTWETINHHLVMLDRERAGRETEAAGVPSIAAVQPRHVATWIEGRTRERSAPTTFDSTQIRPRKAEVELS